MRYQVPVPIDPRDAFTVTPEVDSESTQPAAASQSALRGQASGDVDTQATQQQREQTHAPAQAAAAC